MDKDFATAVNTISIVSVLSVLERCVIGYRNVSALCSMMGDDVADKAARAKIVGTKFNLLMEEHGLVGNNDRFNALPSSVQKDVQAILLRQRKLFEEIDGLVEKYGTAQENAGALPAASTLQVIPQPGHSNYIVQISPATPELSSFPVPVPRDVGIRLRDERKFSLQQKASWGWSDWARMEALLKYLESLNTELQYCLSPPRRGIVEDAIPALVCPEIADSQQLQSLTRIASESENALARCCTLMTAIDTLDDPSADIDQQSRRLELQSGAIQPDDESSWLRSQYASARLHTEQVYVEFRTIDQNLDDRVKRIAERRLKRLAILLSTHLGPSFLSLQSVGFFRQNSVYLRYGLVYRVNQTPAAACQIQSLQSILGAGQSTSKIVTLNERFALARALCTAVMHLHSARWLHRNFHPESIVFETLGATAPDFSRPKLLGFSLARPDDDAEASMGREASNASHDPFLHPSLKSDAAQRFQRSHEYFALGVCLLCIGLWKRVEDMGSLSRNPGIHGGEQLYRRTCRFANANLGFSCGEIYRDAVMKCLLDHYASSTSTAEEDEAQPMSISEFNRYVVSRIESCNV